MPLCCQNMPTTEPLAGLMYARGVAAGVLRDKNATEADPPTAPRWIETIPSEHGVMRSDCLALVPETAAVVDASSTTTIAAVLAFWFVSCALFNHLTPQMVKALKAATGSSGTIDVTLIELAITIGIASTKLLLEGQRVFPPRDVFVRMTVCPARLPTTAASFTTPA